MTNIRPTWLLLVLVVAASGASLVQAQDTNSPPVILEPWEYQIQRNIGGDALFGPFAAPVTFDPTRELANELDIISVTVTIADADWIPDPNDTSGDLFVEGDVVYVLHQTLWLPEPAFPSPQPPPVAQDLHEFQPTDEGLPPNVIDPNDPHWVGVPTLRYTYDFQVPAFDGENQGKLRGLFDYDVAWAMWFLISPTQSPGCYEEVNPHDPQRGWVHFPCDDIVVGPVKPGIFFEGILDYLLAVQNPVLAPPNPPVFADAGPDRTVGSGADITLDASGTFDAFNIGFDPDSPNVFVKDDLQFTWEWVDGPVRVPPVQADASDPTATVNFTVLNDVDHPYYEYKVTVSDGANPEPSTDTVRITVVDPNDLINLPPVAKIVAPDEVITVGSIITLCGRQSCDPDCDPDCGLSGAAEDPCADPNSTTACEADSAAVLNYRWQQVNELGGLLTAEQIVEAFQPLSDLDQAVTTWQAITPGKFYFRLLVDDGANVATDVVTIEVLDTEAAAAAAVNDSAGGTGDDSPTSGFAATPALCGAGLMPVALVPVALCVMRRRLR